MDRFLRAHRTRRDREEVFPALPLLPPLQELDERLVDEPLVFRGNGPGPPRHLVKCVAVAQMSPFE